MEFFDEDIYQGVASRLLSPEITTQCNPQVYANSLWAMATAELEIAGKLVFDTTLVPVSARAAQPTDPATTVFGMAAKDMMRRPFSLQFSGNQRHSLEFLESRNTARVVVPNDGAASSRGLRRWCSGQRV